jgi:hypothetical protein
MHVDLKDATLMFLAESAAYPELAGIAQSAHDALADGHDVPHTVLSDIIGKASEKGVLRAMHRKYAPAAWEAMLMPICREIDRQKPVPPRRPRPSDATPDPLTSPTWPA